MCSLKNYRKMYVHINDSFIFHVSPTHRSTTCQPLSMHTAEESSEREKSDTSLQIAPLSSFMCLIWAMCRYHSVAARTSYNRTVLLFGVCVPAACIHVPHVIISTTLASIQAYVYVQTDACLSNSVLCAQSCIYCKQISGISRNACTCAHMFTRHTHIDPPHSRASFSRPCSVWRRVLF